MHDKEDFDAEAMLGAVALHALIGKFAHDLVGPLGTQLGFLDLLAQSCTGEEEQKYLDRVTRQSKKLLDLVATWRDGIAAASESQRQPVDTEMLGDWLGCETQADASEYVPASLVHAARLVLKWWSLSAKSGEPQASIKSVDEEVSVELILPGLKELPSTTGWQPDEDMGSWHLYLARLIIGRAHGRIACNIDAQGCRLQMTVPV